MGDVPTLYSLAGQTVSNKNLQSLYQFPNIPFQSVQIRNQILKPNDEIYLHNWTSQVIHGTINKIYRNKNGKHIKLKYVEITNNGGVTDNGGVTNNRIH